MCPAPRATGGFWLPDASYVVDSHQDTGGPKLPPVAPGANWCPGCRDLGVVLKENADVAACVKKGFVLVLVDTDYDTGKKADEKYVPRRQRNSIPHLAVLDPTGKVLKSDNTQSLADGDDYNFGKVKAFLAEWSPAK